MFSVLYIGIVRESVRADSFLLTYYLLNYSGNYITVREEEKLYKSISVSGKDGLLREIGTVVNRIDADDSELFVVTSNEVGELREYLALAEPYYYIQRSFSVQTLEAFMGVSESRGVYDLYISRFGNGGGVRSLLEMVDALIVSRLCETVLQLESRGILLVKSRCLGSSKWYLSFAWGTLSTESRFNLLGAYGDYIDTSYDTRVYDCNKLMTDLQVQLVESGLSIENSIIVGFNSGEIGEFQRVLNLCLCEKLNKSVWVNLEELMNSSIKFLGLIGGVASYVNFGRWFALRTELKYSAREIGEVLQRYAKQWGLQANNSLEFTNKNYMHDFSMNVMSCEHSYSDKFGVVLDCEGTIQYGATEIGGLIIENQNGVLYKIGSFRFERADFTTAFPELLKLWLNVTKRKVERGITVYTYGANDETMFLRATGLEMGRKSKRKYAKYLNFVDVSGLVGTKLNSLGLTEGRKLSDVAEQLGVAVCMPKHNALNDAKTLFNVLSMLNLMGGFMK